ncbi:MAG: hypothetical protein H0V89_05270 [Deltaproteobacteria bacterium]|nr:hypothetical protein [Deltaproteobacteria bacterium]
MLGNGLVNSALSGTARVFQQCLATKVVPRPDGPPEGEKPRITVAACITAADGKAMARCWYLLEGNRSNHRIAGITTHPVFRRMYAAGQLPATVAWEQLPASEGAVAWAASLVAAVKGEGAVTGAETEKLVPLLSSVYREFPNTRIEIAGSARLEGTVRHAVGLRFLAEGHAVRERWISLDERNGVLVPFRVLPGLLPQTMLDGM